MAARMDHQILCAVRSCINLNKMVPSAQCTQASLQALCLLQVSIAAKSGQVKTLHAPFPNISSAGNIMSSSINLFKINIHLTQLNSLHAAADIDSTILGTSLSVIVIVVPIVQPFRHVHQA